MYIFTWFHSVYGDSWYLVRVICEFTIFCLCLKLMRSRFWKIYVEQAVDFFQQMYMLFVYQSKTCLSD